MVGGVDEEDDVVETELEPLQVYHDEDEMCQPNRLEDQGRECFLFFKGSTDLRVECFCQNDCLVQVQQA